MQPINSSRSSGPSNWHAPDMRKDLKWPEVPKTKFQSPQHTSTQVLLTGPTSQEDGAASSTAAIHTTEKKNVLEKTQKTELSSPRIIAEAEKSQPQRKSWLKLGRFVLPKSTWPEPHLSIGTRCNRMDKYECWEAIGPAKTLFTEIAQSVAKLLDDRMDELEEGEPVAVDILTFGMYMMGKTPNTARPTLLFTCQRPKPRRRAIKFIKESSILNGKPKIALAQSSVVPTATSNNFLRLLAGNTDLREMCELRATGRPSLLGVLTPLSSESASSEGKDFKLSSSAAESNRKLELNGTFPKNIFGLPVICSSTGRKATIGGLVLIHGKYYGLTVAHVFDNLSSRVMSTQLGSTSKQQHGDPEFAFDSDQDDVEDASNAFDEADVVITSQGMPT